jgi:branched-chain amino acid transport system substrate-binding protein
MSSISKEERMKLRHSGLALAALLAVGAATSAKAQEPVRIGYAADMSGACGPLVDGATKGFRLGVEELNAAGGLLGRKIEVIERDTKTKPDEGAKEVRDLIVNGKVDVITGVCSSAVLLAETAVSAELKVPFYSALGNSQNATMAKGQPYFWQVAPNVLMESLAVAEYVAANKAWKKIAPLAFDYEWGHTSVKSFSEHLKKLRPDIEILPMVAVKLGETNMTSYITAVLAQKPDLVYGAMFGGGLVNLVKQGKAYGFFQQTSLITLTTVDFLQSMGADLPDTGLHGWARGPFTSLLDNAKAKAFVTAFKAKNGKEPDDYAVQAYDGLMFYAEAVKAAKSTKADDVLKAVPTVKYEGLRGATPVRALDGQMAAPSFVGPVAKDAAYPFMIMKDATRVDASKTMPTEEMVKAARAAQ